MVAVLSILLVFVVVAAAALIVRAPDGGEAPVEAAPPRSELARGPRPWIPLIAALALGLGLWLGFSLNVWVAGGAGSVLGVALFILFGALANRRAAKLEGQLADAIDLMVSALRSGASLVDSLAGAADETPRPLRPYLQELLERIRLGERPEVVLANLETRLPLESFRLFSLTLGSHWQGGGSLATSLSNVGRTLRDRVDVSRRIRSQTVETHASVIAVLVVTYGLALLMWTNYPERFDLFAGSELGAMLIGVTVLLQAVGLFWIARLTRIEV